MKAVVRRDKKTFAPCAPSGGHLENDEASAELVQSALLGFLVQRSVQHDGGEIGREGGVDFS